MYRRLIRTRIALGYDEPEGEKKSVDDVGADLDAEDTHLEDFLSEMGATFSSTGTWVTDPNPTLIGTGWVQGDGTLATKFLRNAGSVEFISKFTVGAGTTAGAGGLGISLPVLNDIPDTGGVTYMKDASTGNRYGGIGELSTTYAYVLVHVTGSSVLAPITSTVPVVPATGDVISISGTIKTV